MKQQFAKSPYIRTALITVLRVLAACALFGIFYAVKFFGLRAMNNNPLMKNVAGFWSAPMLFRVDFYLSLLTFFSLASVFSLHDAPYHHRVLAAMAEKDSFFRKIGTILRGSEFAIQAAVLALCILFGAPDVYFFDLIGGYFADMPLPQARVAIVCIMLPALLLIALLAHLATVGWWTRRKDTSDISLCKRILAFVKQLIFTCILYLLVYATFPIIYPVFDTLGKVVNIHPLLFLIPLCIVLGGLLSYRYVRAILARVRFVRRLTHICRKERWDMGEWAHPYASLFSPKDGLTVRFTTSQGSYSCKLICATRRKTPLILDEDGNASYDIAYGLFGLDFFTDTVSYRYAFEAQDKKLLILSPSLDSVYVTNGKARRRLESGDRVMEYLLYDGENLLRALERGGL